MKTLELNLKKDVLIVDLEDNEAEFINGNYDFLCDGSELTEEIASELVDKSSFVEDRWYHLAKRGFKANVESKGFHWLENPLGEDPKKNKLLGTRIMRIMNMLKYQEWKEAEEKTFKNPLIFVKK